MEKYKIVFSPQAKQNIDDLYQVITYDYTSPITALKYLKGLYKKINTLKHGAESYVTQTRPFYRQYGFNVRAIYYKKLTIIYLVVNNCVYIRAIISSDVIRGM